MSDLDLEALRADVDGWRGEFFYEDGYVKHRAPGTRIPIDYATDESSEALVRMLNAVGPLVAEVERLRGAIEERRDDVSRLTGLVSDLEMSAAKTALAHDLMKARVAELERAAQAKEDADSDRSR